VASVGAPNAVSGVVTGTVVGSDPENDPLTFSGSGETARGSVVVDPGGTFTYTPTAEARHNAARIGATDAERTDSFTVTVADDKGATGSVPVSVSIAGANVVPTATASVGSPEASTGAVAVTVNASDTDADSLTWQVLNGPANGAVQLDPVTRQFIYIPTASARQAITDFNAGVPESYGLQFVTLSNPATINRGTFSIGGGGLSELSDLSVPGTNVRNYISTFFTATATQSHTFGQNDSPVDTVMVLYNGRFNPASPGTGAIVLNDDTYMEDHAAQGVTVSARGCGVDDQDFCPQVTVNLTAGQTVELVVTTYRAGKVLDLPQTFYSTGPGRLTAGTPPASSDTFTFRVSDGYGGTRDVVVTVPITAAPAVDYP
jgi:VCBS repeat-containing protein